jgi:hypothetical protein
MHTILMFATRKPAITPSEFRHHYENIHIPLVRALAGPLFPVTHSRRYVRRLRPTDLKEEQAPDSPEYPAVVLSGLQGDFTYDAVVEMRFESVEAADAFFACLAQPEVAVEIAKDCEVFMDQTRMLAVIVEDVVETKRDAGAC